MTTYCFNSAMPVPPLVSLAAEAVYRNSGVISRAPDSVRGHILSIAREATKSCSVCLRRVASLRSVDYIFVTVRYVVTTVVYVCRYHFVSCRHCPLKISGKAQKRIYNMCKLSKGYKPAHIAFEAFNPVLSRDRLDSGPTCIYLGTQPQLTSVAVINTSLVPGPNMAAALDAYIASMPALVPV